MRLKHNLPMQGRLSVYPLFNCNLLALKLRVIVESIYAGWALLKAVEQSE
ncbi:MAG TPA: hypothetical protein VJ821_11980 [Anaerolineales bacterium]|nr:hypothetical protein [Anaerolineales bacterium]